MKTLALLFFATFISNSSGFIWRLNKPVDCKWLPWKYEGCTRTKQGVYLKRESRQKVEAINGGKPCRPLPRTRMNQRCEATDYIASTIWEAINIGEKRHKPTTVFHRPRPSTVWRPFQRPAPTVTSTRNRTQNCLHAFTDPASGIRMLGNKCRQQSRVGTPFSSLRPRLKRQIPSIPHRDVLFLVDESGSVGKTNFKKELELVKAIAGGFCEGRAIGRDKTRVAVTTFSEDPSHRIYFNRYYHRSYFLNAVDRIRYRDDKDGATCLIDALKAARTVMFTTGKGSRVPTGTVDGLIILITDGCKNCYKNEDVEEELARQQQELENAGIFILSFMISVQPKCEQTFITLDDGSLCFQGYNYPSWAKFETEAIARLQAIPIQDCTKAWTKPDDSC